MRPPVFDNFRSAGKRVLLAGILDKISGLRQVDQGDQ